MTWAGTYTNVTYLGATDWLVGETNGGGGFTFHTTALCYKDSGGIYQAGGSINVAGGITTTGNTVLGDANSDTHRINGIVGLGAAPISTIAFSVTDPSAGNGRFEVIGGSTIVTAQWFDRNASAYVSAHLDALDIALRPSGSAGLAVAAALITCSLPVQFKSYTVGTVPSASSAGAGATIYVSNESGGACLAVSNGTVWKRVYSPATTIS